MTYARFLIGRISPSKQNSRRLNSKSVRNKIDQPETVSRNDELIIIENFEIPNNQNIKEQINFRDPRIPPAINVTTSAPVYLPEAQNFSGSISSDFNEITSSRLSTPDFRSYQINLSKDLENSLRIITHLLNEYIQIFNNRRTN
ncbi:9410_t:CDS:2 [Gigaspora rosea]|nr:9410_t:CDS:2 [Gigaspora rosea]